LYCPAHPSKDTEEERLGRKIYEEFTTVVVLREQCRIQDDRWLSFLHRSRYGLCTDEDIELLRGLVLGSKHCPETNFEDRPWSEAVLITSRHCVRTQWNEASIERHCRKTRQTLLISKAYDTIGDREVTNAERYTILTQKGGKGKTRGEKGGLPHNVPLAIGMQVMVTLNVHTDLDVANGARGEIVGIGLHSKEPPIDRTQTRWHLRFPPQYVLVKLQRTKAKQLPGLELGVIPITPAQKTFSIRASNGQKKTVTRRQHPITPAYSFTDYRSQGQTIPYVIVDISTPPSGQITAFNAYVALSRSKGRDTIRLLRGFDPSLFTTHASEFLRVEDERIDRLDRETMEAAEKSDAG